MAAVAGVVVLTRRYPQKAARSAEICRSLGQVHLEFEHLWNGVWAKDDADLVSAWEALSERQRAIVEHAPRELPLSPSLARRSQLEADRYWTEQRAPA